MSTRIRYISNAKDLKEEKRKKKEELNQKEISQIWWTQKILNWKIIYCEVKMYFIVAVWCYPHGNISAYIIVSKEYKVFNFKVKNNLLRS